MEIGQAAAAATQQRAAAGLLGLGLLTGYKAAVAHLIALAPVKEAPRRVAPSLPPRPCGLAGTRAGGAGGAVRGSDRVFAAPPLQPAALPATAASGGNIADNDGGTAADAPAELPGAQTPTGSVSARVAPSPDALSIQPPPPLHGTCKGCLRCRILRLQESTSRIFHVSVAPLASLKNVFGASLLTNRLTTGCAPLAGAPCRAAAVGVPPPTATTTTAAAESALSHSQLSIPADQQDPASAAQQAAYFQQAMGAPAGGRGADGGHPLPLYFPASEVADIERGAASAAGFAARRTAWRSLDAAGAIAAVALGKVAALAGRGTAVAPDNSSCSVAIGPSTSVGDVTATEQEAARPDLSLASSAAAAAAANSQAQAAVEASRRQRSLSTSEIQPAPLPGPLPEPAGNPRRGRERPIPSRSALRLGSSGSLSSALGRGGAAGGDSPPRRVSFCSESEASPERSASPSPRRPTRFWYTSAPQTALSALEPLRPCSLSGTVCTVETNRILPIHLLDWESNNAPKRTPGGLKS